MAKRSAGILLYRERDGTVEVLLVHPGGPLFARRDLGAWSIPKGEYESDEEPLAAARREFAEETGARIDADELIALGDVRYKGSGKTVTAWAVEGDLDPADLRSNTFTMEWPPRSGRGREFPEVDRAEWFTPEQARAKLVRAQVPLVDRLVDILGTAVG